MPRRTKQPPHTPYVPSLPCQRKRRFKNESDALKVIETTELMNMKVALYSYQCPYCLGWHLSSGNQTK